MARFNELIGWMYPIGRTLFPNGFCTLKEVGLAMVRSVTGDFEPDIVEGKDIIELAKK